MRADNDYVGGGGRLFQASKRVFHLPTSELSDDDVDGQYLPLLGSFLR